MTEQLFGLLLLQLDDRRPDLFLRNTVQQELFFLFCQFFLLKARSGIKNLIQIYFFRYVIRGEKESVTAVFIQKCLQLLQYLRIHLFDLALDRMREHVLCSRPGAGSRRSRLPGHRSCCRTRLCGLSSPHVRSSHAVSGRLPCGAVRSVLFALSFSGVLFREDF